MSSRTPVLAVAAALLLFSRAPARAAQDAGVAPATQPTSRATDPDEVAMRTMVASAQGVYDMLLHNWRNPQPDDSGRPSPEELYRWSRRIDLESAATEGHLRRMRELLAQEEALAKAGRGRRTDVLAFRYYVAEAEILNRQREDLRRTAEQYRRDVRDLLKNAPPAP